MKTLIATLWLALQLAAGAAFAQAAPPNEAGITMGHWHLNSRDVEANKKIFVALGGVAAKPGAFDIVKFPGVVVFLHLRPGSPPATGGTVGTVITTSASSCRTCRRLSPGGRPRACRCSPAVTAGPIKPGSRRRT